MGWKHDNRPFRKFRRSVQRLSGLFAAAAILLVLCPAARALEPPVADPCAVEPFGHDDCNGNGIDDDCEAALHPAPEPRDFADFEEFRFVRERMWLWMPGPSAVTIVRESPGRYRMEMEILEESGAGSSNCVVEWTEGVCLAARSLLARYLTETEVEALLGAFSGVSFRELHPLNCCVVPEYFYVDHLQWDDFHASSELCHPHSVNHEAYEKIADVVEGLSVLPDECREPFALGQNSCGVCLLPTMLGLLAVQRAAFARRRETLARGGLE